MGLVVELARTAVEEMFKANKSELRALPSSHTHIPANGATYANVVLLSHDLTRNHYGQP
jgi:hypothetical protein